MDETRSKKLEARNKSSEARFSVLWSLNAEPVVFVGLMTGATEVRFTLWGDFTTPEHKTFPPGEYYVRVRRAMQHEAPHTDQPPTPASCVELRDSLGSVLEIASEVTLIPANFDTCFFTLHRVTVGKEFHWQREESQSFRGTLRIGLPSSADTEESGLSDSPVGMGLRVINEIPLESYLVSVISSEMSASAPVELLKAHAIISRSWLMAQILKRSRTRVASRLSLVAEAAESNEPDSPLSALRSTLPVSSNPIEIIRWTGHENHADFDVCADDHCQRYQGIAKAHSQSAFEAVAQTRGLVLTYQDEICDARFSKCCGGMTEHYRSAWEDRDVPYLRGGTFDGDELPAGFSLPLTEEANAAKWITGQPPAYCRVTDRSLLERILPDIDLETRDFFRWERALDQDEIQAILKAKLGLDLGPILALEPLERGLSGRIVRLKIVGERASAIIGKELEIRRALSWTHLYSSAFIARPCSPTHPLAPDRFRIVGAGWGHGVGLCQIGAACMAAKGKSFREILSHYYDQCVVKAVYD